MYDSTETDVGVEPNHLSLQFLEPLICLPNNSSNGGGGAPGTPVGTLLWQTGESQAVHPNPSHVHRKFL